MAFVAVTMKRLRSYLSQHPEWRVLFVCDGCTDATPDIPREAALDTARLVGAQSGSSSVPVANHP